jgi:hypothetical protein
MRTSEKRLLIVGATDFYLMCNQSELPCMIEVSNEYLIIRVSPKGKFSENFELSLNGEFQDSYIKMTSFFEHVIDQHL